MGRIFERVKGVLSSRDEVRPILDKNDGTSAHKDQFQDNQPPTSTMHAPKVSRTVYVLTFCAALSSCNLGFDIGVNTDAGILVQQSMNLSDVQLELFMGSINLYAIVGALISSRAVSNFGLRVSFIASAICFVAGIIIQVCSSTFELLMFGRIFVGVGVGFGMTIGPMYISEIAPKHARGSLVSWAEIGTNTGILLGFMSGLLFYQLPANMGWRMMFATGCLLPIAMILLAFFVMTESPRWLVQKNKDAEALRVLRKLYPEGGQENSVENILQEIEADIDEETKAQSGSSGWMIILCSPRPAIRRMMLIGVGVGISVQLSGIDAIQYYLVFVLEAAGIRSREELALFLTGLGILKLSIIFVASFLVDKLGRRKLMFMSLSGMIIALLMIASDFIGDESAPLLVLFGLALYLASFSLGVGPLTWIIPNEIFPTTIRARAVSISILSNRVTATLVSSSMLSLANALTWAGYFVFLAALCSLILAFFYVYLPETKGKALEDMAHYFMEVTSGRRGRRRRHEDEDFATSLRYSESGIEILT